MGTQISVRLVKIRKSRHCFGCCATYLPHARLHAHTMRDYGSLYTIYLCDRCNDAASTLRSCESYGEGDLKELWPESIRVREMPR